MPIDRLLEIIDEVIADAQEHIDAFDDMQYYGARNYLNYLRDLIVKESGE